MVDLGDGKKADTYGPPGVKTTTAALLNTYNSRNKHDNLNKKVDK